MRANTLLAGLAILTAASATVSAQQPAANNTGLVLEIMARRTNAAAGDFDASQLQSYVYAAAAGGCGLGAADNAPATTPAAGWYVTGKVLGTTKGTAGDQLVVTIDWERRWDNGAALTQGPRGSMKLTMSAGDTIVLDRIPQAAAGNCPTGDLRLVTSVVNRSEALRPESMLSENFTRGFAGRGAGRGGQGGGAATAGAGATGRGSANAAGGFARGTAGATTAGQGAGAPDAAGAANATASAGRGGGRGANAAGMPPSGGAAASGSVTTAGGAGGRGAGRGAAFGTSFERTRQGDFITRPSGFFSGGPQYTAELWLVHKQPGGEERVQQLSTQFGPAGAEFSFPPVSVTTSRGVVTVDINGRLQLNRRPGAEDSAGTRSLYGELAMRAQQSTTISGKPGADSTETSKVQVSLSRRARSSAAALDTSGASSMAIDLPKAEEVLSFEFPPLQKSTEDLLAGHKFSLRLRLTPVK